LVDHNRAAFPAVPREIALTIALKIQVTSGNSSAHWQFPDRGVDFLTSPRDVTREPNID
jgi:hypothetical protein